MRILLALVIMTLISCGGNMSLFSQLSKNSAIREAQMLKRRTAPARKDVIPQTTQGSTGGAVVQPSGGLATQLETKGDLLTFSDIEAILGIGADGERLEADSAQSLGMKWSALAAIAHTDLSDMPSGSNADHDDRYYTQAEVEALIFWIRTGTVLSPVNAGDTLEIAQTSLTGNALKVSRDLAAANTNSPVVEIVQDNAGDDQPALRITQDGNANALRVIGLTTQNNATIEAFNTAATGNTRAFRGSVDSSSNDAYSFYGDAYFIKDYADYDKSAAPNAASFFNVRLYALTDGLMYARDDGTVGIHKLSNILTINPESADYDALTSDDLILCDPGGGSFTITLYASSGNAGRVIIIKNIDAVTDMFVAGNGFETIDGVSPALVAPKGYLTIVCDGSNWHIIGN